MVNLFDPKVLLKVPFEKVLKLFLEQEPETFTDPTGVKMKQSRWDCAFCSAPGMECVDTDRCVRFQGIMR